MLEFCRRLRVLDHEKVIVLGPDAEKFAAPVRNTCPSIS
jgi:hypothetical protein